MGELYERILGEHPTLGKIPVHAFQAAAGEWAEGSITGAEAQAIIEFLSGNPLGATAVTEVQDLVATVTSIALSGSATAIADARARRAERKAKIDRVLLLADTHAPGYNTAAAIIAKLGVPAR